MIPGFCRPGDDLVVERLAADRPAAGRGRARACGGEGLDLGLGLGGRRRDRRRRRPGRDLGGEGRRDRPSASIRCRDDLAGQRAAGRLAAHRPARRSRPASGRARRERGKVVPARILAIRVDQRLDPRRDRRSGVGFADRRRRRSRQRAADGERRRRRRRFSGRRVHFRPGHMP